MPQASRGARPRPTRRHVKLWGTHIDTARQPPGGQDVEKDTKTQNDRTLALDRATVEVLGEHLARYVQRMAELGLEPSQDAFVFSARPTHDRPYSPSRVTHRYSSMCAALGDR
jgi:hypothetical protein